MRVDFYITDDATPAARLRLACRLTEKAYAAGHRVLVTAADDAEAAQLDDLLWTFADGSFVPHSILRGTPADEPVLVATGASSTAGADEAPEVLLNLASEIPACASRAQRVIEIIDGDPARRLAGRSRFKAYRDMGCQPGTHELSAGSR